MRWVNGRGGGHARTRAQSAAGAFAALSEAAREGGADAISLDFNPQFVKMLELVMLAQAQECFYLKAVLGPWSAVRVAVRVRALRLTRARPTRAFGGRFQTDKRRTAASPSWLRRSAASTTRRTTRRPATAPAARTTM